MSDQKLVSKRVNVTLPDVVAELLEQWADHEGRSVSNLTAYVVEKAVEAAVAEKRFPVKKAKEITDGQR